MADNNEYQPIYNPVSKPNTLIDTVIGNRNNIIEPSAINVFVTGEANYVGENCEDIVIINSSGCVVVPNAKMVTIINSSGVVAYNTGDIYIRNSTLSSGTIDNGSYRKVNIAVDYILTTDETVEIVYASSGSTEYILPLALGHNEKFNIKNSSLYDKVVYRQGSDTIDITNTSVILAPYDSITVQSDGVSNYIII